MSTLPDNEFDLDKLFLPAWAQEPSASKYAKYEGEEERPDRRGDRDRRGPRPPRRDGPPGPRRDDRRPRGERRGPPRPEGGAPAEPAGRRRDRISAAAKGQSSVVSSRANAASRPCRCRKSS